MAAVFGADAYRKSTDVSGLGKSAGKKQPPTAWPAELSSKSGSNLDDLIQRFAGERDGFLGDLLPGVWLRRTRMPVE